MKTAKLLLSLVVLSGLVASCAKRGGQQTDPRAVEADKQVQQKYGKSLAELETVKLIAISPHNTDIENEYEAAFSLQHAVEFGQKVDIDWRDVGGGSTAILRHLRNVYSNSDTSGIDIVWGGGDYNFQRLAEEGILQPMEISDDVLANVPEMFGGHNMFDPQHRWCGSAVSGFGVLYNKPLLERLKIEPPKQWEDLASPQFYGLVGLTDPTQSGSAASSYQMIVQSGKDWPSGWAKLLAILGNAKKFYSGAGDAAEAVPSGEVALSTCIDFYGTLRVVRYPDTIVYVSPKGQTSFGPDPIAILRNPPNGLVAQRLVNFVLSRPGQALWALLPGTPDGPARVELGRQPIRRDVYEHYAGKLSSMIVNPYASGESMAIDTRLWSDSFSVLRKLVWAAAVKNRDGLRAAKKKLIETSFDADRLAEFNKLPEDAADRKGLGQLSTKLRDKKQADIIITGWISFFRDKYKRTSQ